MRYIEARYWISEGQAKFADSDYFHFNAVIDAFINRRPLNLLDCKASQSIHQPVWIQFDWSLLP